MEISFNRAPNYYVPDQVFTTTDSCSINITGCDSVSLGQIDLLALDNFYRKFYGPKKKHPRAERVIINEPATIVFFDDGTKVVTKCGAEDEYNPLFGVMACCLRKVGKNRVRIDAWEPIIDILGGYLADAKECRVIADMLNATADALETNGAMEQLEEYDERNKTEFDQTNLGEAIDASSISSGIIREVDEVKADVKELDGRVTKVEGAVSSYERTRQTIRNLIDKGEL